ncbi:MerR family regulatory protein [Weissella hellenica]|uniref:MerR family regulatory protein n=1 Tax=Weissella hellenica TaxID=46256 RepID=A0ABY0K2V2_WEIHE|nr:hypothetical protein WHE01_15860 [Weissella hellenica]SCC06008.1 MerR family regulatory protein [Weissella hellenica]
MPTTQKAYNIGEFSQLTGIPTSTLRYYESENLIMPQRSANGHRYYTSDDFDWLLFFKSPKGCGNEHRRFKTIHHPARTR